MDRLKRTWAEISLDHLEHNYHAVRALLRPETKLMAVVKADGYGHGARQVSETLQNCGADWFGVSNILEARQLRASGITRPILILGYTPEENVRNLFELSCVQCVFGEEYANRLSLAAARESVTIDAHIKLDTGMNRLGFVTTDIPDMLKKVSRVCYLPNMKVTGVFTHFAMADEATEQGRKLTALQHRRFAVALEELNRSGFTFEDIHCCNSAGTLFYPEYHHTMVRPGIALYGCSPNGKPLSDVSLKPVMTLRSVISSVKTISANEVIGYGGTHAAYGDMKLATVPIGYADGYSRSLSNRGYAYVNDTVVPVVGRVSMDQTILDISACDAKEGDNVILFGNGSPISIENIAGLVGTISYEITCGISRRVQRNYIHKGAVVEVIDYTQ